MRTLHVIRTLDPAWGGTVEAVRSIAYEGRKHDIETEVACIDDPHARWLHSWNIPVHAVGEAAGNFGRSGKLDSWLDGNIQRFDAVIVNGIWMYFSYAVWKAAKKHRVPYYVFVHGALDPWFRKYYPQKQIKKSLYWLLFEHKVMRDATATLFTTEEERILAHRAFLPYKCRPLITGFGIPDPPKPVVAEEKEAAAAKFFQRYERFKGRKIILFLARIHEKKGIDLLIKALSPLRQQHKDSVIVIAGPGEKAMIESLKRMAEEAEVSDHLLWTGPLYDDSKWLAMRAAEAYILPSHQENFGISVVEALACHTPVLISNKVNIWREIDLQNAGLVAPDSLPGTTQLLKQWSELGPRQKTEMSYNARKCFEIYFDISSSCGRLFDLLRDDGAKRSA